MTKQPPDISVEPPSLARRVSVNTALPRAYTADSEDGAPSSKTADAASRGSRRRER